MIVNSHAYLPQRTGGSEVSTHEICLELTKKGLTPAVACTIKPYDLTWLRFKLAAFFQNSDAPHSKFCGYRVYRGWNISKYIANTIEDFKPDGIIINGTMHIPSLIIEECMSRSANVFYYIRDTNFDSHGFKGARFAENLKFIANSSFTASVLREQFGNTATVIPPIVNSSRYRTVLDPAYVLLVNPEPMKGGHLAVDIAASRPDIPFLFVQTWPDSKTLQSVAKRAERLSNISWIRPVKDMRKIYRGAKILLVPSQVTEAWGRVITESQASGIPAVASNLGGVPEALSSGGILVEPDASTEVWVRALDVLWDHPEIWKTFSANALALSMKPEASSGAAIDRLIALLLEGRKDSSSA